MSGAARVCQAAYDAGIDMRGAQFTVGGEPVTAARLAEITRVGAQAIPRYATAECSIIAYGCRNPEAPDDVHVAHDHFAIIQPGTDVQIPALPPAGLLVTMLSPITRLILINASLGDQAVLSTRACGCPLAELGWPVHLHTIRSHEKLTAGGMTFLDTDVVRVLEEILPQRFGGTATDYQLLEEDDEAGHPQMRLLVHPRLGDLDPNVVSDTFLTAIGAGSDTAHMMEKLWRQSGFLQVERREPQAIGPGKILHVHVRARPNAEQPGAK
jgi:hypothetical protein